MPEMQLPAKIKPFLSKGKRYKIIIGGRGSAKSMSVADICLMDAMTKGIKTGCFREHQNSIEDSVHALLGSEIERHNLQEFEVQNSAILYKGQEAFKFRGLARNTEGVKSMHGFSKFWTEEAQTTSFKSLKDLTPTLRTDDSEIWMTANPRSSVDAFSQRFIKPYEKQLRRDGYYEDDLHMILWMNYQDNPFFPAVLEAERAHDEKTMTTALYRHVWLGEYYDEVENTIIPVDWFDAAIDAHEKLGFKPEGAVICSFDPSDEGGDSKGLSIRKGSVILDVNEMLTGDASEGMDWALDRCRATGSDWFVWDCDGLGVSLKRQVDKELNNTKISYHMFKGSESPEDSELAYGGEGRERKTNRDTFANKRAQYWWRLRDKFQSTHRAINKKQYINPDDLISLSSDIKSLDQLRSEVCRIPLKRNSNGTIQIMSKIEMAKAPYSLPSPNLGDAVMMGCFQPKILALQASKINFAGWGNG